MTPTKKRKQLNKSLINNLVYSPLVNFQIPNFVNIQTLSFKNFLTHGLIKQWDNLKVIEAFDQSFSIKFYAKKYKISRSKWTPSQAVMKRKTYACTLYLPVQVTDYKTSLTSFHWVKLANLPMMTKYGHFIINGCPRVIMNQVVRSPGVYFKKELNEENQMIYSADFIASRGAWLRLEMDPEGRIWAKLKTVKQIPIILFLRCLGVDFSLLNNYFDLVGSDLTFTLSKQQALLELSNIVYPNIQPTSKNGQIFLQRKFLNPRSYSLSPLGRTNLNQKLGQSPTNQSLVLTGQDILFACLWLIDLSKGMRIADDIDDLQNRKIQPCGELLQSQLQIGLTRLEKTVREKYKQMPYNQITLNHLLPASPINSALKDFFGTNPLSQMMDQTNALAELTHKRRLSCLGPGGIQRDTASMAIRGIHPTHYGRICPIETPEGKNAGLVNSITIYAHLNKNGSLETPLWKVYKGLVLNTTDPLLFDSKQEGQLVIAPGDIGKTSLNLLSKAAQIPSRKVKQFKRVSRNSINYMAMSPIQMISVATSLIPFLEHDDGNRALMGSNMQRQAVPTIRLSKPIVGTGLESRIVSDTGYGLQAKRSGFVSYVDQNEIIIYSKCPEVHLVSNAINFVDNKNMAPLPSTLRSYVNNQLSVEKPIQAISKKLNKFQLTKIFQSTNRRKNEQCITRFKPLPVQRTFNLTSSPLKAVAKNQMQSLYSANKIILQGNNTQSLLVLNNAKLFSIYNGLFVNDFFGQLALLRLMCRKVVYNQKSKNLVPIVSKINRICLEPGLDKGAMVQYSKAFLKYLSASKQPSAAVNLNTIPFTKSPFALKQLTHCIFLPFQQQHLNLSTYQSIQKALVSKVIESNIKLNTPVTSVSLQPKTHLRHYFFSSCFQSHRHQKVNFETSMLFFDSLKPEKRKVTNVAEFSLEKIKPVQTPKPNLLTIKYPLEKFHGSNQHTYRVQRPTVHPGQWVSKGDILADNSSSYQGELAIGQNILVAYTPWEGYNFEDAVLISQRLIDDELYTSLHIERYEVEVRDTEFGMEQLVGQSFGSNITGDHRHLDSRGIAVVGTWVGPGDVLVNKIAPIGPKLLTPYEKLLYDVLEKKVPKNRNTSLLVPKNVSGRVIHVEWVESGVEVSDLVTNLKDETSLKVKCKVNDQKLLFSVTAHAHPDQIKSNQLFLTKTAKIRSSVVGSKDGNWRGCGEQDQTNLVFDLGKVLSNQKTKLGGLSKPNSVFEKSHNPISLNTHTPKSGIKIYVYLAEKRTIQVGDKIAGRHGNKGIVSNILPVQDMPYLPDGTSLDLVLNPLGVPSRMNVGQIFECLLGLAGSYLGQNYKIRPFDELYGCEASRSLVYSKLYEARIKTGHDWLFNPNSPGKIRLFDGRTGDCFKQPVTVGKSYILKLIHLVDEKIHARSTGPYNLVTQQPLRGRSQMGGQRVGEMEVWALEGFGAAYILQEILTIKSDAINGREQVIHSILKNKPIVTGTPESFKVLIRELQSVCLNIYHTQWLNIDGKRDHYIVDMINLP